MREVAAFLFFSFHLGISIPSQQHPWSLCFEMYKTPSIVVFNSVDSSHISTIMENVSHDTVLIPAAIFWTPVP